MTPSPLAGRDRIVDRVRDAVTGGRGLTLVGPAGIGKTAIVRRASELLPEELDVVWVTGTAAVSDVPLAAFAAFLPPAGSEPGLASLVHVRRAVTAVPAGRRRVLVVDDAHALDETSAAVVRQLALQGLTLVITQRSGTPAPDAVSRLWREGTLDRLDIGPLDLAAIAELAADLLHGTVDPRSAREVWRRCDGNPLFGRELVLASRAAGEWTAAPTGWRWDVGTTATPRLTDLLRDRLERLTDDERSALTHLAFGEPMGIGEFGPICAEATLEELERIGLVTAEVDRRRLSIRFTHPLHAEVIRRTVSPLRARAIRSALVDSLRATGTRRRDDLMRLATLALDAGAELDRPELLAAARTALAAGDVVAGLRIARTAFERAPDFETGHVLADALYEDGRYEEIERHWATWGPMAGDDAERAFVAMHRAISHYYRAGDEQAAFDGLARAIESLPAGAERDELTALQGTLHMMSGRTEAARHVAEPLLRSTDGRVVVQASLATFHALRAVGRTADALELGRGAMRTLEALGPVESLVSATVFGTGEASALLVAGRLGDAMRSADAALEIARQSGESSAEGLSELSRSEALAMAGRFDDATRAARHAESAFARVNHRGFQRWATSQRAYVAALAGAHDSCARALADLAAIGPHPAALFDYVLAMARLIEGYATEPDAAADDAVAAARRLVERGDLHGGIRCAYELIRLGDRRSSAELQVWAAASDSELHAIMAAHALALDQDDGSALGTVAERHAAAGALVFAIRAAEHAAAVAARVGDDRTANRWRVTSSHWREHCRPIDVADRAESSTVGPATPGGADAAPIAASVSLTRREREIALLAAQGLAARTIAERLFLSPRTVENHLAKAYHKLGVGSRAELAHALAPT